MKIFLCIYIIVLLSTVTGLVPPIYLGLKTFDEKLMWSARAPETKKPISLGGLKSGKAETACEGTIYLHFEFNLHLIVVESLINMTFSTRQAARISVFTSTNASKGIVLMRS